MRPEDDVAEEAEDEEVPAPAEEEEEEEEVLPMEVAEGGAGDGPREQAGQPAEPQGKGDASAVAGCPGATGIRCPPAVRCTGS